MADTGAVLPQRRFGETTRPDTWWLAPLLTSLGLGAFVAYSTWAAFQSAHYHWGPYLSPFYSPELFGDSPHSWFGPRPAWWPLVIPFSPALLILWAPGLFRLTCYYYRGAYYKSFWADPPACAVGEPRKSYIGEQSLPLILQNVHRFFLYLALVFILILAWDAWTAFWFPAASGGATFGIGVGTLVLTANVVLLGGYTFSCHSLRHLVGGGLDEPSKRRVCALAYGCVSRLNARHMLWAWMSLFWVGFADFYVRMLSMGVFTDWRIL